jgi:hypothetical protein
VSDNPYDPPSPPQRGSRRLNPIKYITAVLGAIIIFVGALGGILLFPVFVYPELYKSPIGIIAMYAIAIPSAITAAVLSVRGTLKQYADKDRP